jgi:hypothetical protein
VVCVRERKGIPASIGLDNSKLLVHLCVCWQPVGNLFIQPDKYTGLPPIALQQKSFTVYAHGTLGDLYGVLHFAQEVLEFVLWYEGAQREVLIVWQLCGQ